MKRYAVEVTDTTAAAIGHSDRELVEVFLEFFTNLLRETSLQSFDELLHCNGGVFGERLTQSRHITDCGGRFGYMNWVCVKNLDLSVC